MFGCSEEYWFHQQAFPVQWDVRECIKRRTRSSAHKRIPNTHMVTDLSEIHGASQFEVPNDELMINGEWMRALLFLSHEALG